MEQPAERAEEVVDAYRNHFIGSAGPAARDVAHRIEATEESDDTFIGTKGPLLQALPIANWSDSSWESFASEQGIGALVRLAFSELGFERLYDFQERSIEAIKDGDNTVITAATGRGKTEAWLIPIIDEILQAKRGKHESLDPEGVKATLIYPTKALAQDQLKRLIQYLYHINTSLPKTERITVGIYDGDTPTNPSSKAEGYLNSTFKYFECPGYNDSLEKCQDCGKGVHIRATSDGYHLEPEKAKCVEDVPLDFLRLTKHEILNESVDILLTNPDTINLKLINVNASDEHDAFIYDPKYLVFDEVHTYDSLFGSYTATLAKRIRALRRERGTDELQVIASSATVENSVELFRKISGAGEVTHVSERPREISPTPPDEIPRALYEEPIQIGEIVGAAKSRENQPKALRSFTYSIDNPEKHDNERAREMVADELFDYLTKPTSNDPVAAIQSLHQYLADEPATRRETMEHIREQYGLSESDAEVLLYNFRTIGEFSGLLENRSHLFSWPLDGYYACARCDAVYRSAQEQCTQCDYGFVTRSRYCRSCHDEHLVAWACHDCGQLEPYIPTEEGTPTRDEIPSCPSCSAGEEEDDLRMTRVTFQPNLQCEACGSTERRSMTANCDCGAETVRTGPDVRTCIDPSCRSEYQATHDCSECESESFSVESIPGDIVCPECGVVHEQVDHEITCDCGNELTNSRLLGWVCRNHDCNRIYHTPSPPESCECGHSTTFSRDGLQEVFRDEICSECETEVLPTGECRCTEQGDTPDRQPREGVHEAAKVIDVNGRIRHPGEFRSAAGCQHSGLSYDPDRRFDELVRSPNNLAVTTSQYLLRAVADDEGYDAAKMLSFADSHRDMNELARDFNEPEAETLLDQTILEAAQESGEQLAPDSTWRSLDAVLDDALGIVDEFHQRLSPPETVRNVDFDLKESLLDRVHRRFETVDQAISERLRRRAIPHVYQPRLRERDGSLVEEGLLDVRLQPELLHELSDIERSVVSEIVSNGSGYRIADITSPDSAVAVEDVVLDLVEKGVLSEESEEYASFDPAALEVTVAGSDSDLKFRAGSDSNYASLDLQFGTIPDDAVPLSDSVEERASPENPLFSGRAFRAIYSSTRILVSRVYHGMTDKRARRELEYLFREGDYPHFLSSGPTMELGVDIGALDALLLYGTPPNMNAYLQRVGRAGRRSNSALVHSVSQRNPIDFYYYDNPADLISAEPKPVPLNEHNDAVLRISLTWAVFDYVAAEFQIPWDVEYSGPYGSVSGGDNFHRRTEGSSDEDYAKLTQLMTLRIKELGLDERTSKLAALGTIVHDHQGEIRDHLESILNYSYCEACGSKHDRTKSDGPCEVPDCDGTLIDAVEEHRTLINDAVDSFTERFIDEYTRYRNQLEDEIQNLQSEQLDIRRKRRRADAEEASRLLRRKNAIGERKQALEEHLNTVKRYEYSDFLSISGQSEFAFNMRNVSASVGLTLVSKRGSEYKREEIGSGYGGREMQMAIKELHPGAAYLHEGDSHIVSHARFDEFESSELRESARETGHDKLAHELVCPSCRETHSTDTAQCSCGSDVPLKQRKLVSLDSVEAYRDDLVTAPEGAEARYLLEKPDEEVQNTFAERETTVLSFDSNESFSIQDGEGNVLGTITHGSYSVLVHTDSYRAKYKSGEIDPHETPFEICGEENCDGVVYTDENGDSQCSANAEHSPNRRGARSKYVRLGYTYHTDGLRVSLPTLEQSHTFAHGIRVALQSLGGVSIREITESVDEEEEHVDIFDSTEGGADVSRQLVVSDGNEMFDNFVEAVRIMAEQLDCSCENGCPLCLYQYGCDERNRTRTFDRSSVAERIEGQDLRLTINSDD